MGSSEKKSKKDLKFGAISDNISRHSPTSPKQIIKTSEIETLRSTAIFLQTQFDE